MREEGLKELVVLLVITGACLLGGLIPKGIGVLPSFIGSLVFLKIKLGVSYKELLQFRFQKNVKEKW